MAERPAGRKLVLVFDECQWTAQASPELPSVLQGFLDRPWKASGDILLILCASYVGFMEKEVLVREVSGKMARYPNRAGATLHGRVFTRNRPRRLALPEGISLHSLAGLYGQT